MPTALYPLLLPACLLGMGLIMWLTMQGGSQNPRRDTHPYGSSSSVELNGRREAIARLRVGQLGLICFGGHPRSGVLPRKDVRQSRSSPHLTARLYAYEGAWLYPATRSTPSARLALRTSATKELP